MGAMASQITRVTIAYSAVCSDADQRKYRVTELCAGKITGHQWIPRTMDQ